MEIQKHIYGDVEYIQCNSSNMMFSMKLIIMQDETPPKDTKEI